MRIAICQFDEISVRTAQNGKRMGRGAIVDLDEVLDVHDGAPLTLADALGERIVGFQLVETPVQPSPVLDVEDDGATFSDEG